MSEVEGIYGQFAFQTANFLGRGETVSVSAQRGVLSNNYQVSITEPYLFDRPITGGITLFSRKTDYYLSDGSLGYSEVRAGMGVTGGVFVQRSTRLFFGYTYEVINSAVRDDLSGAAGAIVFNVGLDEGRHHESRISPSLVYNTVDHPYTPRRGMRLTATYEVSGGWLGGNVNYLKPDVEAVAYVPHTRRTAIGVRAQGGWIRQFGRTETLPYYRRFFLGGENQIRGVDYRTVGPLDDEQRATGGHSYVLFNAEYYLDIGPLRAVAFHDAGQAFREGQPISLRDLRTSTGAEARFMVPMLNVPLRLIYSFNFYRDTFQPARTFRVAVGTMF
jgi:outer membrane protein insertion porin family